MEAIRLETRVAQDGVLQIPELKAGEEVEVIILRKEPAGRLPRKGGWAKGLIRIEPDFDEPIPGMEDYR